MKPPRTEDPKVNPVFEPLYSKYEVPVAAKSPKKPRSGEKEVRLALRKQKRAPRLEQTTSMVYVPYEICSYTRKARGFRDRGKVTMTL
jgi:hypothetical protein